MAWGECWWELEEHWSQALFQSPHAIREEKCFVFPHIQAGNMADGTWNLWTKAEGGRSLTAPACHRFSGRYGVKDCVSLNCRHPPAVKTQEVTCRCGGRKKITYPLLVSPDRTADIEHCLVRC